MMHTYCEGNQCADLLAKLGARSQEDLVLLHHPPDGMMHFLLADARGVSFMRQ